MGCPTQALGQAAVSQSGSAFSAMKARGHKVAPAPLPWGQERPALEFSKEPGSRRQAGPGEQPF